tara:strand:+ start:2567 stop:3748 length:1182 start_codon:yes stop_codon:yes gene_type:complete
MAIKFPKIRPVPGEIVHPDDLNGNISEFANEVNGNLDNDNFRADEVFGYKVFEVGTFNATKGRSFDVRDDLNALRVPHNTTAYVKRLYKGFDTYGAGEDPEYSDETYELASLEFSCNSEGFFIIDFQCRFKWLGNGIRDLKHLMSHHAKYLYGDFSFDNNVLADTGFFNGQLPAGGWCGISGKLPSDEYLGGGGIYDFNRALSTAGSRAEVADERPSEVAAYYHGNFPQGIWHPDPVDHYAVQFRIVCDGNIVCESGFLSNGNHYNACAISGVIPVTAGSHQIDVEVRGMDIRPTYSSSIGLGSADDEMVRGQSTPQIQRIGSYDICPMPEYKKRFWSPTDLKEAVEDNFSGFSTYGHIRTKLESTTASWGYFDKGISCNIHDRALNVQFRKR